MPFPVQSPPDFTNLKNNVASTLAVAMASGDITMTVASGNGLGFPAAPFYVSCEFEVMLCNSKAGDVLSVTRGQDGTTSVAHVINSVVECRDTAVIIRDAYTGVNSAFTSINALGTQIEDKTALPPDTVYLDTTQELTHKTIDLSTPSKDNVIIGNVQPDPASLNYQNILLNGGFEDWDYPPVTTLPAGTSSSGTRTVPFANGWNITGVNDSAITATRDTSNSDPGFPSGVNCLLNVSTVQGGDRVNIVQSFFSGLNLLGQSTPPTIGKNDLYRVLGQPFSVSARVKSISGNVQVNLRFYSAGQSVTDWRGPQTTVTTSYTTIKWENKVWFPAGGTGANSGVFQIEFQGTGVVAVDNVMLIVGPVATNYRPSFPSVTNSRLGNDVARQNLLVNGGFEIWQRGNGPFTSPSLYSADGWAIGQIGTDVISVSKNTANVDPNGSLACMSCTFTLGTGAGMTIIYNMVNGSDGQQTANRPLTFSCRVRTSNTNAIRLGGFDGTNWIYSAYASGAGGTYETLSVTWTPTIASNNSVAIFFSATGSCFLDNAMLVVGTVPADYVPLHPADELARCLRYYEVIGGVAGANYPVLGGYQAAGANVLTNIPFKVTKNIVPTITKAGTWTLSNVSGQPTVVNSSKDGTVMQTTNIAAGYGYAIPVDATTKLTVEANP